MPTEGPRQQRSRTRVRLAVALILVAAVIGGVWWWVGSSSAVPVFDGKNPHAVNSIGMTFRLIPAGTFRMGWEKGGDREKPVHEATISRPFYLGEHEVTQEQYERVMGTNPSHFQGRHRPVETVSWEDAREFCRRLSELEGVVYRLPTEAEWEYACRAASTTAYCFGDSAEELGEYAWFDKNSARKRGFARSLIWGKKTFARETWKVGGKRPNAWGLYDIHGNVLEWCQDWYGPYEAGKQADPTGPTTGKYRVLRGGSWNFDADSCRSAFRGCFTPVFRDYFIGFRVARPLP